MDKLSRDAMLARQSRLSYGKWKAMQDPVRIEKKIPEGWLVCKHCGKAFAPKHNRERQYCDWTCQRQAYDEKRKEERAEYMREYRERKAAGTAG